MARVGETIHNGNGGEDHDVFESRDECPTPIYVRTVELDLIATEMSAFPSKSRRNKNDSDLIITIL